MSQIETFEKLLAGGQDSALLRFSLGSAYVKAGEPGRALEHLACAVEQDPQYSAAWKAYGKALVETGDLDGAITAFERGIAVAEARGDIQAAKEMNVFKKRSIKRKSEFEA